MQYFFESNSCIGWDFFVILESIPKVTLVVSFVADLKAMEGGVNNKCFIKMQKIYKVLATSPSKFVHNMLTLLAINWKHCMGKHG